MVRPSCIAGQWGKTHLCTGAGEMSAPGFIENLFTSCSHARPVLSFSMIEATGKRSEPERIRQEAIDTMTQAYLEAATGDAASALRTAVTDLLETRDEADSYKLALDAWVSRGYVRGLGSERLACIMRG